jgi:hypothetical protein
MLLAGFLFNNPVAQDRHDGNLEALGVTVARSLYQAVPSSFQVTVPVRDI